MKKTCILLFVINLVVMRLQTQEAVCIVPVTDLLGGNTCQDDPTTYAIYQNLPLNGPADQVKRIDQLIFNERAIIQETRGNQCRICIPSHGYCNHEDHELHHEFWTLAQNLAALDTIQDCTVVPPDISQTGPTTVTLRSPWYDYKHHQWFSAGTRFVCDDEQDDPSSYRVLLLSPRLKSGHVYIPRDSCIDTHDMSRKEEIKLFLELLDSFTQNTDGCAPYVLGGNSFAKPYALDYTVQETAHGLTTPYPTKASVHSGFDCAALVFRVAQMAGLPFTFKNSSAIRMFLTPCTEQQPPENGDIIYIPGHIMVLFDKEHNTIIEARTQTHGYGSVHKINLEQEFKEITSFEKLWEYHTTQKSVTRLNADGTVIARLPITVLSLSSLEKSSTKEPEQAPQ